MSILTDTMRYRLLVPDDQRPAMLLTEKLQNALEGERIELARAIPFCGADSYQLQVIVEQGSSRLPRVATNFRANQ